MKSASSTETILAIEEIQKAIEGLAIENEGRAAYVQEVFNKSTTMQEELVKMKSIIDSVKKTASDLHMLSLNTAIESARSSNPAVGVIAKEMDKMSKSFTELSKDIERLGTDISNKTDWINTSLATSVNSVETTSAALEQINASTEQVIAAMNEGAV
jgi:methyl-accepting chemotaxis protein